MINSPMPRWHQLFMMFSFFAREQKKREHGQGKSNLVEFNEFDLLVSWKQLPKD